MTRVWLARMACFFFVLYAVSGTATAQATADIAITNITVIDPENRAITPDQSVYIRDGRIIAILPTSQKPLASAKVIQGKGKFLIPGLMDMHVHTASPLLVDDSFELMIANGVTGIRDMGSDCWEPQGPIYLCIDQMRAYGAEILAGKRTGPRLLRLASAFVQSDRTNQLPENPDPAYSPITKEQGRHIVHYLNDRGVDLIKMYHQTAPDAYRAILSEAQTVGLEVSGHIPIFISTREASDLGQRTIEHARDLVTDCSRYGQTYRTGNNAVIEGVEGATWPKQAALLVESVRTYDSEICTNLLSVMAANNTYYVPTHVTREMEVRAGDQTYQNDLRRRYVKSFINADWQRDLDNTAHASDEKIAEYKAHFEHGLKLTRLAIEAGVPVMLGTDANDTMSFPGFSVHDEMQHFAKAGVSPMDILRAATTVPAAYLARSGDFGGVSEGKIADLVILTANPLADIRNTVQIEAVIFNGRHFDHSALAQLLQSVEAREGLSIEDLKGE